jgi:transcriptional regulator with XRE-family HTH domain
MNLREARERAKKTREVAAVELGISSSTLRAWEKGINVMPSSALPKLQEVLGLSEVEVMDIIKNLQKEAS